MHASRMLDLGRREFLARTSALGAAGLLGLHYRSAAAEPPPETTKIRLAHAPFICVAPQYLAEEFLPSGGFTEWKYVPLGSRMALEALAEGKADIAMWNSSELLPHLDAGRPLVVLAGLHGGCYQIFGNERVRAIRDLKGKTRCDPLLRERGRRNALDHAGVRWHQPAAGHHLDHWPGPAQRDGSVR